MGGDVLLYGSLAGVCRGDPTRETGHEPSPDGGIERKHGRQRHGFGRFKRKAIMVSKAKDMVELTMALFARFRINGDVAEIFTLDMIT
jgi:hypothetical protein